MDTKFQISEIIKRAFSCNLKEQYEEIFEQYYPGSSNGINETNQVFNFCNSLINELKANGDNKTFAAFELPLGKGERMDGVVFSKHFSSVFFIETKKLKNNKPSYQSSLEKDLKRMLDPQTQAKILKDGEWKDVKNKYIICLADHWQIKDVWTNEISNWFKTFHNNTKTDSLFDVIFPFEEIKDFSSEPKYMLFMKVLKMK